MEKRDKKWLTAATALVVTGATVFSLTACSVNWKQLFSSNHVTNTFDINEDFNNISMKTDTADIVFAPSGDGQCKIVCYEKENAPHSVSVENDTLLIKGESTTVSFGFDNSKITLYLPQDQYVSLVIEEDTGDIEIPHSFSFESVNIELSTGDVSFSASISEEATITASTGDICVQDTSVSALALSVSTGKATLSNVTVENDLSVKVSTGKSLLTNVTCKNLTTEGTTGDITLKNVIASEKFSIVRSTGDVKFDGCDAAEIVVETSTGSVKGTFLSEKIFVPRTSTGRIEVPTRTVGGFCEVTTATGNIILSIVE